jgi:hypothetical protein
VHADLFAVPDGAGLPLWHASQDYNAWLLLDGHRPLGMLAPGLYNRRTLTEVLFRDPNKRPTRARPLGMPPATQMLGASPR